MQTGTDALAADRAIALRLPRTWGPFFGRHGRLTNVQRAAIPALLDGESLLLCAPTAGGKTLAACAPLVETRLGRRDPWTILYISPTRALVNDLYERLSVPLEQTRLRIARRTGDHRDLMDEPPHVLVTTPESFDSLLCRGARPQGHLLAAVDAVVLDEIHLLHASARGEQVRWLLERLRRLRRFAKEKGWTTRDGTQIVALSATVSSPEVVKNAFLPNGRIVVIGGGRNIETIAPRCDASNVECALPAYIAQLDRPEKVLVFSNARLRVDKLAFSMRPELEALGYVVRAHHGSLAQREREATEHAAKTERRIVIFATSTLEIGIDIGDIDLVVLDGPAPDVSALLQRVGRGNRRDQRTRMMMCAGSITEVLIQSAMVHAARDAYLGPSEQGTYYAVARQQLASYIFQAPKRSRGAASLMQLVSHCVPQIHARGLIDHLTTGGEFHADADGFRLGELWTDATARGDIHGNIEGQGGHTVIDQSSGEAVAVGVRYGGLGQIAVGGNLLDVKAWRDRNIEVRGATTDQRVIGAWSYTSKSWIQGAGQPQAVRRYLGFAEDEWPVVVNGPNLTVFHFGGARRKALLNLLVSRLPAAGRPLVDNWTIRLKGTADSKPTWLVECGPAVLDMLIAGKMDKLEKDLALPHANQHLPVELRLAEIRSWLRVEDELPSMQATRWTTVTDPKVRETLLTLQSSL